MALQRDSGRWRGGGGRIRSLDWLLLPFMHCPFLSPPPLSHQSLFSLPPPLPLLLPIADILSKAGVCYSLIQQCHLGAAWALDTLKVINWLPPSELFNRKPDSGPPCQLDCSGFLRRQAGLLGTCAWKSNSGSPAAFPLSHQRWTRFL